MPNAAQEPRLERRQPPVSQEPVDAGAGPERQLRRAGPGRHVEHCAPVRPRQPGDLEHGPRRLFRRARAAGRRDYPTWNLNVTMSYPIGGNQAEAQHARARVQRSQAMTRLRALEVQIAAEVANAALTVQSNLKRVEAATRGARAGAKAARGRTEPVRGRHHHQLLRRAGAARSARCGRTPSCARWPTIASRSSISNAPSSRPPAAVAAAAGHPRRRAGIWSNC